MKVIIFSRDASIIDKDSAVARRMNALGLLLGHLSFVAIGANSDKSKFNLGGNISVYPTNSFFKIFAFIKSFFIAKRLEKHDIVSSQDPFETGLIAWLLARVTGAKFELQIHTDFENPLFVKESFLNRLRRILARFLLPRADSIRVVSQRISDSLIANRYALSVSPYFLPVHTELKDKNEIGKDYFKKRYPQFNRVILMVGRLETEKNYPLALSVFKKVLAKYPRAGLFIAGFGSQEKNLKLKIKNLKLEGNVVLLGNFRDTASLYKSADIFLHTSDYEGFGLVFLEAAFYGCPIVTTDTGAARYIFGENNSAIIVSPRDEDNLTYGVLRLLSDKKLRAQLSLDAEKSVRKFIVSREAYADKQIEEWKSVLKANKEKVKLVYVLPRYDENDTTHFSHIYDFLKEVSQSFDLFLIVESGAKPPASLGYKKAQLIKFKFIPLKVIEIKFRLLSARLAGYKNFYVHYSFISAFLAFLITRLLGGRTFYWNCGEPWKYKRNFLREWFEGLTYRSVDFLVTGTSLLARQYANYYHIPMDRIKIMPNWIDLGRFRIAETKKEARAKLGLPKDAKLILFIHRLSRRKGAHMIIPVARMVVKEMPETLFLVVGTGPEENKIKDEAKFLQKHIRFEGAIPNAKIPLYFKAADVFFMPSEEEGFPRVLLETMSMGVPFVASDVGAVRLISPAFMLEFVISSGDEVKFAEKLIKLLKIPVQDSANFSVKLKEWVRQYDISAVAKKFLNLFD